MTDAEKVRDWVHFYKIAAPGYQANALVSCLMNDGESCLRKVLKELKLELTVDLVKAMAERKWW